MSVSSNYNSPSFKDEIKKFVQSEFEILVKSLCSEEELKRVPNISEIFSENLAKSIVEKVENPERDKKLSILYTHEKNFLDILKEYKEEIKFATTIQSEIRKEEATFFSSTLKEVCNSLKETQIDPKCQVQWIYDLVSSYTSSLKLSSRLAEEHVIYLLGDIQKDVSDVINKE